MEKEYKFTRKSLWINLLFLCVLNFSAGYAIESFQLHFSLTLFFMTALSAVTIFMALYSRWQFRNWYEKNLMCIPYMQSLLGAVFSHQQISENFLSSLIFAPVICFVSVMFYTAWNHRSLS